MIHECFTERRVRRLNSTSTVRRRLYESGLQSQIAADKTLLKEANKKKEIAWAKKHKDWPLNQWKSVFCSDESKFQIFGSNHVFVRYSLVEWIVPACVVLTNKHRGGGVMVMVVLQWHAIPSGLRLGPSFDNNPKHAYRLCKGYLAKKENKGVAHQMTGSPQSPSLKQQSEKKQAASAQHTRELLQDCQKNHSRWLHHEAERMLSVQSCHQSRVLNVLLCLD